MLYVTEYNHVYKERAPPLSKNKVFKTGLKSYIKHAYKYVFSIQGSYVRCSYTNTLMLRAATWKLTSEGMYSERSGTSFNVV